MNTEDRILVAGETFEAIARELLEENKRLLARVKELEGSNDTLRTALHDIFEHASRQKSNRDCAVDEGLINTAKAAVRVIRKVCDERKEELHQRDTALNAARVALELFVCETCNGTKKFKFECMACLAGEPTCTCDKQEEEPCPQCQTGPIKEVYDKRDRAISQIQAVKP